MGQQHRAIQESVINICLRICLLSKLMTKFLFLDAVGIYQCGPASRHAIKEGEVELDYDGPFVFAEVNADCMYWNYDSATGKKTLIFSKSTEIGASISTKAVGKDARVDVTRDYKYEEGK